MGIGKLATRISEARKAAGMTQAALAKLLNVGQSTVAQWERGNNEPPLEKLVAISQFTNKPVLWFIDQRTMKALAPPQGSGHAHRLVADGAFWAEELAQIAAYDLRLSAGSGALVATQERPQFYQPFRMEWLRGVTQAPADQLALLIVDGDSMYPTLHHRDQALIDRTKTAPKDGIYALRIFDDELVVKRMTVAPVKPHRLSISSDNPQHRNYEDLSPDDVHVIGRVIWIGRQV